MATRVVPRDEVIARLDALDAVNPPFDQERAEQYFLGFIRGLRSFKEIPPVYWFSGIRDYRNHLLDQGIYLSGRETETLSFNGNISSYNSAIAQQTRHGYAVFHPYLTLLAAAASPASSNAIGLRWLYPHILHDENMLRAYEAGLGFWHVEKTVIALFERPGLRMRREQNNQMVLHSTVAPAVRFPNDPTSDQYWLRGERVREFVVMHPERITIAHIRAARTAEQRRTLIDQYGLLKYSIERGFKPEAGNKDLGAILYVKGGGRGRYGGITTRECVVELVNSTPEPDGTYRHFARRVPGHMQSAHQAVAWTFGFTEPAHYHPSVQT